MPAAIDESPGVIDLALFQALVQQFVAVREAVAIVGSGIEVDVELFEVGDRNFVGNADGVGLFPRLLLDRVAKDLI